MTNVNDTRPSGDTDKGGSSQRVLDRFGGVPNEERLRC